MERLEVVEVCVLGFFLVRLCPGSCVVWEVCDSVGGDPALMSVAP